MEIQLISEALFKENSPIKEDTLIGKFIPYIGLAQRLYIDRILGVALVNEIKAEIKAAQADPVPTPYPISDKNKALIQLIAPALSFYTVYQALPFHWAAIVNKGVTIRESENSKGVSINDIAQLRKWIKDDAEALTEDLRRYLCGCRTSYPLWTPSPGYGCADARDCGDNTTTTNNYDFGIFIPRK